MSRTVNESIKNKPENSGKSAAGKGTGAKKASSGAEPAVKAGKAGTRAKKSVTPEEAGKKGPQYHKGLRKGKNHPFLRGSKISQKKGFCRD